MSGSRAAAPRPVWPRPSARANCGRLRTQGRRRKGRGVLNLRIASFAGNLERQSLVRCTVSSTSMQLERLFNYLLGN
ncbi:hypothetical protein EVAR_47679_1 [Eumeta japonica]|uniref:Uncharacterized protein n=1 Tax=Eumeta variegata TaxID=151549 RepID=A0A4C1XZW7_EUMVA|nr:hypothetical protein EVAR_47679_1 [Eumeta japonica]